MASFTDVMGRSWQVELDGPLMGEVRDIAKVDLADLSGTGYLKIENDAPSLVAALKILCRAQITAANPAVTIEQFARAIRKDTLTKAAEAVIAAAADFFPTSKWSETLSRCESARKMRTDLAPVIPMLSVLDEPGMPSRLKDAVMEAIGEHVRQLGGSSAGAQSLVAASVTGLTEIPSTPATDSPASAGSALTA